MTDRKMGMTYKDFMAAVDRIDVSNELKRYFKDLICKAAMTSLSESEREQYRQHLLEVPWEDVVESAREQGLEEGIEKGIRQVAKSMLSQGLSLQSISKATGLSQKEISKLS